MNRINQFVISIIISVISLLIIVKFFPTEFKNDQKKIYFLISSFLIVFAIIRNMYSGGSFSRFVKYLFIWVAILTFVLGGVSYQYEIKQVANRMVANLLPGMGQGNGDGSVTFYANNNGHFTVTALINDISRVNFLFDTGASTVALTIDDAKSLGIDIDTLNYNVMLSTANGTAWGAKVMLDPVQVGPIKLANVEASVTKSGLDTSLLGMSFLKRLKEFEFKGGSLTLYN